MIAPPLEFDVKQAQSSRGKEVCYFSVSSPSRCRGCKFYQFQGSRGGHCHKLGVLVHGHWRACSLALSPFAITWEVDEEIEGS